jgi:hypothetical protein
MNAILKRINEFFGGSRCSGCDHLSRDLRYIRSTGLARLKDVDALGLCGCE